MKIKIFSGSISELAALERKVNHFILDKHVVEIKQSACCEDCKDNIIISVMYYDCFHYPYCNTKFDFHT